MAEENTKPKRKGLIDVLAERTVSFAEESDRWLAAIGSELEKTVRWYVDETPILSRVADFSRDVATATRETIEEIAEEMTPSKWRRKRGAQPEKKKEGAAEPRGDGEKGGDASASAAAPAAVEEKTPKKSSRAEKKSKPAEDAGDESVAAKKRASSKPEEDKPEESAKDSPGDSEADSP